MKIENPFSLPDLERIKAILVWGPLATFAFGFIYGWCNVKAAEALTRYPLYFDFELGIPLVPWMIYPYLSLNALFFLAAFVLKKDAVKGYCLSLVWGAVFAGVIFYLFPGQLGFQREVAVGYENLFQTMFSIDHPHNLFPSLHVTYSSLSMWAMTHQTRSTWFKWFLNLWLVTIAASVVLVHQHHLFDIGSGLILAIFLYRFVYLRYAEKKSEILVNVLA